MTFAMPSTASPAFRYALIDPIWLMLWHRPDWPMAPAARKRNVEDADSGLYQVLPSERHAPKTR